MFYGCNGFCDDRKSQCDRDCRFKLLPRKVILAINVDVGCLDMDMDIKIWNECGMKIGHDCCFHFLPRKVMDKKVDVNMDILDTR